MKKAITIIGYIITAAVITLMVVFGSVMTSRGKQLKTCKAEVARLTAEADSLKALNMELARMSAISCAVTFEMKNTAVMGVNKIDAMQVAEQVATYTRGELKHINDSINGNIR